MKRTIRHVECQGCVRCCIGETITIKGHDLTKWVTERAVLDGVPVLDEHGNEIYVLAHKEDGACFYLGPDGCTIWHDKPKQCDDYDCLLYLEHFGYTAFSAKASWPVVEMAMYRQQRRRASEVRQAEKKAKPRRRLKKRRPKR